MYLNDFEKPDPMFDYDFSLEWREALDAIYQCGGKHVFDTQEDCDRFVIDVLKSPRIRPGDGHDSDNRKQHLGSSTEEPCMMIPTDASEAGLGKQKRSTRKLKQFNFARYWKSKVVPHLDDPDVVGALTLGMKLDNGDYSKGDPPWECGTIPLDGQELPSEGSLEWYQPRNQCHDIAPFCWALGQKIYPDLKWGFVSSRRHTVAVGWSEDWEQPEWVLDILQFQEWSAQKSLDFVKEMDWKYHDSLARYVSSNFKCADFYYSSIQSGKNARGIEQSNEGVEFTEMLIDMFEFIGVITKSPK